MKKLYDVKCNHCEFIEEKMVNDFYEPQTCTKCGKDAKCVYSPLAIQMKRPTFGRTKDGTKWEFLGAGEINEDSRDINKFSVKK
jgi:hypothetical protein